MRTTSCFRSMPGRSTTRLLAVLASLTALVAAAAPASAYQPGVELFRFADRAIDESSGLAAASRRDDVTFTHNDSGDTARFFAVDRRGCTLARYVLSGAKATDWEDMARGPRGGRSTLWLGDIGDNAAARNEIAVYAVTEPDTTRLPKRTTGACGTASTTTVSWTRFRLAYPSDHGPRDAETLLAHPVSGQLFVVSKVLDGPAVLYAAPRTLSTTTLNRLTAAATVYVPPGPSWSSSPEPGVNTAGRFTPTGGAIAPDATRVVIRTYTDAWEWVAPSDPSGQRDVARAFGLTAVPTLVALPSTEQGEAITYNRKGDSLLTSTEGLRAPVHLIAG